MTTASATRQDLRRRLLAATLPHVPFDGWTRASIDAGAADAGMTAGEARRLFPEGAGEMVSFFLAEGDRAMLDELSTINLEDMRVRDRIDGGENPPRGRWRTSRGCAEGRRPQDRSHRRQGTLAHGRRHLACRRRHGNRLQLLHQASAAGGRPCVDATLLAQRRQPGP